MLREVSIAFAAGCADDGATAQKIAANRDGFLDPTLAENHIGADPDPLPGRLEERRAPAFPSLGVLR